MTPIAVLGFISTAIILLLTQTQMSTANDLEQQFAKNSADFAIDIFTKLSATELNKNIIFSPFSIQTCVALAGFGASGQTAQQITRGLRLISDNVADVSESFKKVLDVYENSKLLKIANKIYVKKGYKIQSKFNEIARTQFHSEAEEIDFSQSAESAAAINKWVESRTNNKIRNLITSGSLDDFTRFILLNAIHFKGVWKNKFDPRKTKEEDFYLNETDKVKVEMMNKKSKFRYGEFEQLSATALEMPYKDSDLSMLVLLPNSPTGLKELEQKLKNYSLLDIASEMYETEVVVKFPKFKVEYSLELTETLKKLGIIKMFTDQAEFSEMLESPDTLKVSNVIHKAFIEVNEEGAEAAATTATVMRYSMPLFIASPPTFAANKPFLYIIRGRAGSIFFAGNMKVFSNNDCSLFNAPF